MTPNLSDICVPARAAIKAGVSEISTINTIKSITNINLDNLSFSPSVNVASDNLERNTILSPNWDYDRCSSCGRCYNYCSNIGYNAITFDLNRRTFSVSKRIKYALIYKV